MNLKLKNCPDWSALARQAGWSVSALARLSSVSGSGLRRHFLQRKGRPPKQWMDEERLRQAVGLLRDGSSIKEIAAMLGYQQQTNFTRKFKAFWGVCPSAFMDPTPQADAKRAKMINIGTCLSIGVLSR
jgi:AraC-like DNA-binding protein